MNEKRKSNEKKYRRLEELLLMGFASMQPFQLPVNPWRPIEERETRDSKSDHAA